MAQSDKGCIIQTNKYGDHNFRIMPSKDCCGVRLEKMRGLFANSTGFPYYAKCLLILAATLHKVINSGLYGPTQQFFLRHKAT